MGIAERDELDDVFDKLEPPAATAVEQTAKTPRAPTGPSLRSDTANGPPTEADGPAAEEQKDADTTPLPRRPPLLPRAAKSAAASPSGRTHFDDLFVADSAPLPAVHSSPEEKVEYLREKLRRAETQMARVREAWLKREAEVDGLEATAEEERKRAADATAKLRELEKFIEQKKVELDAYGHRITQVFAEREHAEKKLRAEMEARDHALEKLKATVLHARKKAAESEEEAERANERTADALAERDRLRGDIERLTRALDAKNRATAQVVQQGVDRADLAEVVKRALRAIEVARQILAGTETACSDILAGRASAGVVDIQDIATRVNKALTVTAELLAPYE